MDSPLKALNSQLQSDLDAVTEHMTPAEKRLVTYRMTQTAEAFHRSDKKVKGLLGPVGCGKSVTCDVDILINCVLQTKGRDGLRRSRWAFFRNTYPELKSTSIATWTSWFPEEVFGRVVYDSPIIQTIRCKDIYIEIFFISLDKPKDVQKLRSLELTGGYFNEIQFMDEVLFLDCLLRTGRYPSKKDGNSRWSGVIWDANPPSTLHWMYDTFEKFCPADYEVFRYEPAVLMVDVAPPDTEFEISKDGTIYINNPAADYRFIQNDPNYWLSKVPSLRDEKIKVDLMGQYGVVVSGRPVHDTYNDKFHWAGKPFQYDPDLELGLGFDFGLTPACAVVQVTTSGRLLMLHEFWSTHMGLRDFLTNVVIPGLNRLFPGWELNYFSQHDPAGDTGSQTDGKSCKHILKEEGIISHPAADTNAATDRRDGLKFFLGRMTDGQPAFALSDTCKLTREGLLGNFMYGRVQAGGEARYTEKPVKNIYSHICEALEYIAMRYQGQVNRPVIEKKANRRNVKPYTRR